ncbi:hypothetical protein BRC67_03065, partial [Halobacteriales archaeon QH_3_68_24]
MSGFRWTGRRNTGKKLQPTVSEFEPFDGRVRRPVAPEDALFQSDFLDGLAEDVAAVQERFADASGLRFTDPEQAHVTLKFLGDTDEDRVRSVCEELDAAVRDAGVDPFEMTVSGLGVFP